MSNWDNYRYLLALERARSFSGAARELGVSQPTVSRRMFELEAALGVPLLERLPEGVRFTAAGAKLCEGARLLERHATQLELNARDGLEQDYARVRLTASEGVCFAFLTQLIARFRDEKPDIAVDLLISNRPADIMRREADIAIRLGDPKDDNLVGRTIATARFGLYGHDGYLARFGVPLSAADLSGHHVIESTGAIAQLPQAIWLREHAPHARVGYSSNSIVNQLRALSFGMGLLAIPTYLAEDLVEIRRVLADSFSLTTDVWLLSERRTMDNPAIRTLLDYLAAEIPRSLDRLSG